MYIEKIRIQEYCSLSYLLKFLLTLSHGQGNVKQSFSVNKAIIDTNMNEISIVSHKTIKDHLPANDLHPYAVAINNSLLLSCKSEWQK